MVNALYIDSKEGTASVVALGEEKPREVSSIDYTWAVNLYREVFGAKNNGIPLPLNKFRRKAAPAKDVQVGGVADRLALWAEVPAKVRTASREEQRSARAVGWSLIAG